MRQKININSQLDALKIKEVEKIFYKKISDNTNIIPKVTPFRGINTDLLYIKDNKILFIKFMDTSEEIFSILDEELIEVMNEEYELLKFKMAQFHSNISFNYVFIMPYVEIEDYYGFESFVKNNIIDKNKLEEIIGNRDKLDNYLKEVNNEIELNLYILDICPEYYELNGQYHLNKEFKKITFSQGDYNYSASMLTDEQLEKTISINYGKTLIEGPTGSGKTSLMMSRAIKLARIYPHHNFIIFTHTKQLCNQLRETIKLLYKENNNLEVHTISSFVFKLAKKYNLILDYAMLKQDYERTFNNLIKQAKNIIKNKKIFKGIFIDESESFEQKDIEFIQDFLYEKKYIFNIFYCECLNIYNNVNIFKEPFSYISFDEKIMLDNNLREGKYIVDFSNQFCRNANKYIKNLRKNINRDIYKESNNIINEGINAQVIKVDDLEDQISAILWEIKYLISNKGLNYSDIAIVYPYNKKRLKNGKTIYFQYLLKKALSEGNIPFIQGDDNLTKYDKDGGVTISNLYFIKNLEYKAVVFCELEMLYNQTINEEYQDYQINDFVGDLNKIYMAINRSSEYLTIITTFNENSSELIKIIVDSTKE
ncbi:DEAD/DEAH box helicase family protein [Terrisporobacter sp.]|uniref:DEAD/DEAH box helicase family protein n=1 Tax=Terrisporobacter sp. TaxID=1965305 RepID=UPI00260A90C9|nr:DEAD/DEAH box helicase family protein [Terrisporobacter sp.]